MNKRLLVMAGGTGGHIFPGLAVADELAASGWQILWLGTADRMEADLVPQAGYDIEFIKIKGVRGKGIIAKLLTPLKLFGAVLAARKVIKTFKPDVIAGFGGYVALPGGIAAKLTGTPLVIHEQNALAGMTNKILAKWANKIFCAFESVGGLSNYTVVGNPIRADILAQRQQNARAAKAEQATKVNLLVVGGSLGAQALNTYVPQAIAQLNSPIPVVVKHQCGKGNLLATQQAYQQAEGNPQVTVQVDEFISDMASAYAEADLVICRAGALTVSEIAAVGVASIFVPLPHAVDDHQTKNAQTLQNVGAAQILTQSQLTHGLLQPLLQELLADGQTKLSQMAQACAQVAKLDAPKILAQEIELLAVGTK
ncbi:undecaprenyldiphospho-muramoylpentapeptide beta-N- acetylglucosaminyltransferase [Catenovulum agarivorans DS-2]|uniref:UDP-N-acetylglucosamine--N-acetylmuramyl-(pentapeptide) pyrophosphoryl-undecaprenol N-acetylglucosamine transferase n=1 Tax=Catenovulum agarivorans DS-2 TaxID=1328313 RepID=W7R0Q6_9ALTE|nr:undecaprenyldiphospho-muramoylpentapeptide beta-N-acetylglucosaminyltransferase [Catenovulum agarivorans]EWH11200.1 undecaprenyldiphospho-muramoylpentapeptide beta-N- acetylglucosaminyltransferase [Catenovulum agarivorans DS-2]